MTKPKGKNAKARDPKPYQRKTRTKKKNAVPLPISLARLQSFLDVQNTELMAFVNETDERRFDLRMRIWMMMLRTKKRMSSWKRKLNCNLKFN